MCPIFGIYLDQKGAEWMIILFNVHFFCDCAILYSEYPVIHVTSGHRNLWELGGLCHTTQVASVYLLKSVK